MNTYQELVEEFHSETNSTVGLYPRLTDLELRAKLILEEAVETVAAMGFHATGDIRTPDGERVTTFEKTHRDPDFIAGIDGLCDLLYVTFGTAVAWGIDLDPFFEEVHRANMTKLAGPKREDGKQLKPEGWTPPDIEGLLIAQENYAEAWRQLVGDEENQVWEPEASPAEVRHERLLNGEAVA